MSDLNTPNKEERKAEIVTDEDLKRIYLRTTGYDYCTAADINSMRHAIELATENMLLKQSEIDAVDEILLPYAKRNNLYIDFSDKEYDGDKEAPMDRIGLLDYALNQKQSELEAALRELVECKNLNEDSQSYMRTDDYYAYLRRFENAWEAARKLIKKEE